MKVKSQRSKVEGQRGGDFRFFHPSFFILHPSKRGLFLSLVAIVGLMLAACGDNPLPTSQNSAGNNNTVNKIQPPVKMEIGYTAPDFTAKTVEGETIQLSQLRGKAVIINFWATWCAPCRDEFPDIIQIYNANKDKLTVIGVNWNEDTPLVQNFIKEFKIGFPVVIDNTGDLITQFRARYNPYNIFINREGIITNIIPGLVEEQVLKDFVIKSI